MPAWSTELFVISTTDFDPQQTFLGSFLAQLQISERRRSQYLLDQFYAFANVVIIEGSRGPGARCALSDRTLKWAGERLLLEFRQVEGTHGWQERLTLGGEVRHQAALETDHGADWPAMAITLGRNDSERAALGRVQFVWRQYLAHRHLRCQAYERFWDDPASLARREWVAQEATRQAIEAPDAPTLAARAPQRATDGGSLP